MTNYEWLLQMGGEERQIWFDAQHVDDNDVLTHKSGVRADDACANDTIDALKLMREFCITDILDALGIDNREKNHTRKMVQALADMVERDYVRRDAEEHVDAHSKAHSKTEPNLSEQSESLSDEADSREKLEADIDKALDLDYITENMALRWLDRQDAITEREAQKRHELFCEKCERVNDEQLVELAERVGELTAQVEKLEKDKRIGWECECKLQAERDALADDLLTCNKEREHYRELFSESLTLAAEIVNLQP